MAPPINFSFLFKAYLYQYCEVVLTVIFKFPIAKEVNIHNNNNNQKIIFNKFSKKTSNIFCKIKILLQQ